jgi:hypothetical protein
VQPSKEKENAEKLGAVHDKLVVIIYYCKYDGDEREGFDHLKRWCLAGFIALGKT